MGELPFRNYREISSIYKKNGSAARCIMYFFYPALKKQIKIAGRLEKIGNIHSDGRPILGLDCHDLLEIYWKTVPMECWFRHISGLPTSGFWCRIRFDTMEECFEDLTSYVHAVETGLSSDPPMKLAFICT